MEIKQTHISEKWEIGYQNGKISLNDHNIVSLISSGAGQMATLERETKKVVESQVSENSENPGDT